MELTPNTQDLINAFHYIKEEEALALQKYADELSKKSICVNIGAGTGTSSVAVIEKRPDLANTFYTIDIRDNDNPFGGLLNEKNSFTKYKMSLPKQIHGDSKEIAKKWKHGKVNFLIIDGDHSYEGASGDILLWEKHLKENAIVFVHDYQSKHWAEVTRAVHDFMYDTNKYDLLEIVGGYIIFKYTGKEK